MHVPFRDTDLAGAAQARQAFENLGRCLAAGGATFADVAKLTFFVTDIAILPEVRATRDAHINNPAIGRAAPPCAVSGCFLARTLPTRAVRSAAA